LTPISVKAHRPASNDKPFYKQLFKFAERFWPTNSSKAPSDSVHATSPPVIIGPPNPTSGRRSRHYRRSGQHSHSSLSPECDSDSLGSTYYVLPTAGQNVNIIVSRVPFHLHEFPSSIRPYSFSLLCYSSSRTTARVECRLQYLLKHTVLPATTNHFISSCSNLPRDFGPQIRRRHRRGVEVVGRGGHHTKINALSRNSSARSVPLTCHLYMTMRMGCR
jgi:hypothetical protein